MLVGDNTVYLWLPNGTRIMSVEGFQDDGSSPVGFIHDPQKDAPIITTADNSHDFLTIEETIASSASGYTHTRILMFIRKTQILRGSTRSDNQSLRLDHFLTINRNFIRSLAQISGCSDTETDIRTKTDGLFF